MEFLWFKKKINYENLQLFEIEKFEKFDAFRYWKFLIFSKLEIFKISNRKIFEFSKLEIVGISRIEKFSNFPNWKFLEFRELKNFRIFQIGNSWNSPNSKSAKLKKKSFRQPKIWL